MTRRGIDSRRAARAAVLLASFCGVPLAGAEPEPAGDAAVTAGRPAWEYAHEWLAGERDRLEADLERARKLLTERAAQGRPELLARLERPPPPKPGYGVLPSLIPDPALRSSKPRRQPYDLGSLATGFIGDFLDAAILARRAAEEPSVLEAQVAEFERLRKRLKLLNSHLDYHRFWQGDARRATASYTRRNELLGRMETARNEGGDGTGADRLAAVGREAVDALWPLRPTPGLALETADDGTRMLQVRLVTDITDQGFLDEWEASIRAAFNDSAAARERRFRVEPVFETVSPEGLYDGEPPGRGSRIQISEHLRRFPEGALVLTTGAARTHARVGRYALVGPEERSPRSLAHEFGHLLGFSDAYLRAYQGAPDDRFGVVFIEWTGLSDDLMGAPATGRVTGDMVDQLLEAYAAPGMED